jgi:hypothetical protein
MFAAGIAQDEAPEVAEKRDFVEHGVALRPN